MDKYFKVAGDLEETQKNISNELEIKRYLDGIINQDNDIDNLNIIGSGSMIISFTELQKMVEEECYIFLKVDYLNPEMIIIEYKKYEKTNNITK